MDVHDADAFEAHHAVVEEFAHAADLPVESLREDDSELVAIDFLDHAFFGYGIEDGHPVGHFFDEATGDRTVDGNDVFFFVVVVSAEDLIDDIAIAGEEDESFTGFIESPDGEDAFGVFDVVDDVILFDACIGGANDPDRFMEGDVHRFGISVYDGFAIDAHIIIGTHFRPHFGHLPVDRHPFRFNELIGRPTRAVPYLAEVFVNPHLLFTRHGRKFRN